MISANVARPSWVRVVREFYDPFSVKVSEAEEKMPSHNMGPEPIGRECPKCGHELVIRWGRYGKFIACSRYPKCKYIQKDEAAEAERAVGKLKTDNASAEDLIRAALKGMVKA